MKIRIEPGDVIIEMLSIVVAILLALAVNNWQEGFRQQHSLRVNVANIVRELEFNQSALHAILPQHERESTAINKETSKDFEQHEQLSLDEFFAFFRHIAPRGLGAVQLQQAAWQIAQSDPSFGVMPADQRLALARIYSEQTFFTQISTRLLTHIPSSQQTTYFPNLVALDLDFADELVAERDLLKAYAIVIPQLRKAYGVP